MRSVWGHAESDVSSVLYVLMKINVVQVSLVCSQGAAQLFTTYCSICFTVLKAIES